MRSNGWTIIAPWVALLLFIILAAIAVSGSFRVIPETVDTIVDFLATIP